MRSEKRTISMMGFLRKEAGKVLNEAGGDTFDMSKFNLARVLRSVGQHDGVSFEEGDIGLAILPDDQDRAGSTSEDSALAYSFRARRLVFVRKDAIEFLNPDLPMPRQLVEVFHARDIAGEIDNDWVAVDGAQEAISACRIYIKSHGLDEVSWRGGQLRHALTKEHLGRIDVRGVFHLGGDPAAP